MRGLQKQHREPRLRPPHESLLFKGFLLGCFQSLFSIALFKLVFNLLFSLWASFIFILLYQKCLDFIPISALLAFWSLISF